MDAEKRVKELIKETDRLLEESRRLLDSYQTTVVRVEKQEQIRDLDGDGIGFVKASLLPLIQRRFTLIGKGYVCGTERWHVVRTYLE